jgi:hypothetical protein
MDLLLQILQHVWGPVCLAFRPALLHFQPVLVSVGPPDEACLLDLVVQLLVLGALLPLALEASRLRLLEDSLEARRLVLVDVGDHLEDLLDLHPPDSLKVALVDLLQGSNHLPDSSLLVKAVDTHLLASVDDDFSLIRRRRHEKLMRYRYPLKANTGGLKVV